jgi:hypothetical protein
MYNEAFNGDNLLFDKFKELVAEFKINTIVETGTFEGKTTDALASLVPLVHTIEINAGYKQCCTNKNIIFHIGSSIDELPKIIKNLNNQTLFFLDAHWQKYCPLWEELKIIYESKLKPVIVIHDFKVPGKDFGFDHWNNKDISHANVEEIISLIYNSKYVHQTNIVANGARRGAGFYWPQQTE